MTKSATPPRSIAPLAAVHPMSMGSAPGTAPASVATYERVFSGVYTPWYMRPLAAVRRAGSRPTVTARYTSPDRRSAAPKASASIGLTLPVGMGRPRVRCMTASGSRSTNWLRVSAPAVASPTPAIVLIAVASGSSPRAETKALTPAVIITYPAMPGFVSS